MFSHSHFVCASLGTRVHTTRSLSHFYIFYSLIRSLALSLSLDASHPRDSCATQGRAKNRRR